MMQQLQFLIGQAWKDHANPPPKSILVDVREAVTNVIGQFDRGAPRAAGRQDGEWVINRWIEKAVLLPSHPEDNASTAAGGSMRFYGKVSSRFANYAAEGFVAGGLRVVPPAVARRDSFIAKNATLVSSYVNTDVYVDEDTMAGTRATVGSYAQIGKNTHLSGGVGIGGVLESLQANPIIIEDNCFIGACSEVVEDVIAEENSATSVGTYLGQSAKIYDRETGEVSYGHIPADPVVVAGNLPPEDGSHSLHYAVIAKKVDAKTYAKVDLNGLPRGD